jgi:protein-disulfide isomerase
MAKFAALALLLGAALVPQAQAVAAPASKAAAKKDWSRTVAVTPQGGFRMGNPAAPVKLVEYGSLACPHCRHFEQTGFKPLVDSYVRSGRVSYEFRNLLISGPDIAISMLTRCAGPGKFFQMSHYVFETQPQWQDKVASMSDADQAALEKLSDQQRVVRYAQLAGFGAIAARFGITPVQSRQCLADAKGLKRLLDMTQQAMSNGISHTPTFIINGKIVEGATWEALEPQIRQAGRG